MENKKAVAIHKLNALEHFKVLNKLGTVFFIMFIVTAFMPFATGFLENSSLYSRAEPTFLILLAVCTAAVFITGYSRKVARIMAIMFIVVALLTVSSIGEQSSQVNSFFGGGETSSFKAGWAVLKEGIVSSTNSRSSTTFQFSPTLVLMLIAFTGIMGCTWSPRYKENKALIASLAGKEVFGQTTTDNDSDSSSTNVAVDAQPNTEAKTSAKAKFDTLSQKAIVIAKKTDALFDMATKAICDKKAQLKPQHVKIALYSVAVLLIWVILF